MRLPLSRLLLVSLVAVTASQTTTEDTGSARRPIQPDHESARANSAHLFNAIHSVGRQWGSAYIHNGFGLLPAVIRKGTTLYHGSHGANGAGPEGLEYLAFEVEYSRVFGSSYHPGEPPWPPPPPPSQMGTKLDDEHQRRQQQVLSEGGDKNRTGYIRGYLHTYLATRDLRVLYIDGQSGAKSGMGTLDSQDILLRGGTGDDPDKYFDEYSRARDLCKVVQPFGFHAVMRAEIGFELIYCDFLDGALQHLSALRSFDVEDMVGNTALDNFYWLRAVSHRYAGLGADRATYDFSSMVSGFMFPINISNTDPDRPDLIRLKAARREHLDDIRSYLTDILSQPRRFTVNWQGIVDQVITHFSDGLAHMGSGTINDDQFISEVEAATVIYYDAPARSDDVDYTDAEDSSSETNRTSDAVQRCTEHQLLSATLDKDDWSLEDELIHAAISNVTGRICQDLFLARSLLVRAAFPERRRTGSSSSVAPMMDAALSAARAIVRDLMRHLAWTDWKRTRRCAVNEAEVVAMWPYGTSEDHWRPGCRTAEDSGSFTILPPDSYWRHKDQGQHRMDDLEVDDL